MAYAKSGRPHVRSRPQRARQTGVINEKSSPRGALQVFGQHDVRGLLVDLVLVDGQSLVDVDRDLADLAHSARTAFLTSPASLSRPRFLIMGAIRFASGFWGAPSTLNMALKISLAIDG